MATARGCKKVGKGKPKKRGGPCGPKLKRKKSSKRKSKKYARGKGKGGSDDCRDSKGEFIPTPACTGR